MSNPTLTPTPIPQSAPAGGLTIIHPPQTATSFYKIEKDHPITFIWNFTSLLATPTHLTVTAVGENGNSYPVGPATDGVIPGTQTEVVWDVYSYNQAHRATPLVQQQYQLQIWDERGPGAPIAPGRLSPNSALKFAMYDPAKYTSIADGWECMGCKSGALARYTAHPAFSALIATLIVCLATGYGMLRRHNF